MIASETITPELLRRWPLPLDGSQDKDARGRAFVVGGTPRMPGPVLLAGIAALRAGAGKLQIGVPASILLHVATAVPEALVVPLDEDDGAITTSASAQIAQRADAADALVIGPGLPEDRSAELVAAVARATQTPLVVDAGALAVCRNRVDFGGRAVLTPHAGELVALVRQPRETIEADPERYAKEAAAAFNACVALKGPRTYIALPDGRCILNTEGHVGLATSGSGDTLAGVIGGILARGIEPLGAAAWGVYLHALAGKALAERMGIGFLARELLAEIPPVMKRLSSGDAESAAPW